MDFSTPMSLSLSTVRFKILPRISYLSMYFYIFFPYLHNYIIRIFCLIILILFYIFEKKNKNNYYFFQIYPFCISIIIYISNSS